MPSYASQNGVAYKRNDVPIIMAKRAGKQQDLRNVNVRGQMQRNMGTVLLRLQRMNSGPCLVTFVPLEVVPGALHSEQMNHYRSFRPWNTAQTPLALSGVSRVAALRCYMPSEDEVAAPSRIGNEPSFC